MRSTFFQKYCQTLEGIHLPTLSKESERVSEKTLARCASTLTLQITDLYKKANYVGKNSMKVKVSAYELRRGKALKSAILGRINREMERRKKRKTRAR